MSGRINKDLIGKLYVRDSALDLSLSPSRLERFSRCPFSHFINYGLKPDERRIFEIAGREIGDVYHQCFMKLSEELSTPGIDITDPGSPWMTVTKGNAREDRPFYRGKVAEYRGRVLFSARKKISCVRDEACLRRRRLGLDRHSGAEIRMYSLKRIRRAPGKQYLPLKCIWGKIPLDRRKNRPIDILKGSEGAGKVTIKL
jgi:hypothetical protein